MTLIDWAIVILAVALAPLGYRQGLVVGVAALGGFAGGAVLGARLGPELLSDGASSPYTAAIALLCGVFVGALLAVLLQGVAISVRDRFLRGRALATADSVGGAALFAALAVAIAWVLGALALNAPDLRHVRDDVQSSAILTTINEVVPPSGPLLNILHRIGTTPRVMGPSADVPAAGRGILADPDVRAAADSTVHVLGTACGLSVSGSGWVAEPGLVVTNAHVIAGEDDTTVVTTDGVEHDAEPTVYRPHNDIAVLRVDGLEAAPLPIAARARPGTVAAVLGYPGDGEFSATPARLGTTARVQSEDSYGRGSVERRMTSFRGAVANGNSGGPLVDARGRVVATVFAMTLDESRPEGLGVPNDVVRRALEAAGRPVDTGPCR